MKRAFWVWVAIVWWLSAAAPVMAEEGSAVGECLEQIAALMDVRESIYEVKSGAYRAVGEFCDQNDYAALLNARIACDEAARQLRQIVPPQLTLSDATLIELMRMGVETDVVEAEILSTQTLAQGEADGMIMYKALLYTSAYQLSQLEGIRSWLSINEKQVDWEIAYDCNLLNYLLLPVADAPEVTLFWNEIAKRWPMIGDALPAWEDDQAALLQRAETLMEEYESIGSAASSVLGQDAYAFDQFSRSWSNADMEALRADINAIAGMPALLPLPDGWLNGDSAALYVPSEASQAGEIPDILVMYDSDVALASFDGYIDKLTGLGASIYQREGRDGDGWQVVIVADDQVLMLYWYPNGAVMAAYNPQLLSLEALLYILCAQ